MKSIRNVQQVLVIFLLLVLSASANLQAQKKGEDMVTMPTLVIGITVDQMRYDYLLRYWNDFGKSGFRKMVNEGFICHNLHYNYMPTYTGPGHASIFTGTTPAYHGIIQNDWYDRASNAMIYCSSDTSVAGVGTASKAGQMSPHYLTASTLGDMIRMQTNRRGKVFGIAMKDRGAILPAGRTADAAYWFVGGEEGKWATSSWYMNALPKWVEEFNNLKGADSYLKSTWNLFREPSAYDESAEDNNAHETPFKGTTKPTFPYDLPNLRSTNGNYELLKATPFGNSYTLDFARALIENEQLGSDEYTDMLCMSFSSTDYIGHQFGIQALETQDCYLRLDEELGLFMKYLDSRIGKGKYVIFLSADHGGAPTPSFTAKHKAMGGYWKSDRLELFLEDTLAKRYGQGDWVLNESNQNVFLNHALIQSKRLNLKEMQYEVAQHCLSFSEVMSAYTASDLSQSRGGDAVKSMIQQGFDSRRSGDVIYTLDPGYIEYGMSGTTHGSPYAYDTHVPAIFYGCGVLKGESHARWSITDIAPTVSMICGFSLPDATTGVPVEPAIRGKK
jgi:predicted AlkP superfamily pyrophosphatase or phosphodiesterase